MKVGYAVLYDNGELVISQSHTILSKKIYKDYGEFADTSVPWKHECKRINKVKILDQVKSNCMQKWFYYCINLTSLIDFSYLDVSECTDFLEMFCGCKSLEKISTLQNWNVSNGQNFSEMFSYCDSLEEISLPNTLRYLDENLFKDCNPNLKIRWKQYLYTYADLLEYKKIY